MIGLWSDNKSSIKFTKQEQMTSEPVIVTDKASQLIRLGSIENVREDFKLTEPVSCPVRSFLARQPMIVNL